jgi:hypothetical protein
VWRRLVRRPPRVSVAARRAVSTAVVVDDDDDDDARRRRRRAARDRARGVEWRFVSPARYF